MKLESVWRNSTNFCQWWSWSRLGYDIESSSSHSLKLITNLTIHIMMNWGLMFSSIILFSCQWWITSSRGWFRWKQFDNWVWQKYESWFYWNMGWIWKVQSCFQHKHSNNHAKVGCLLLTILSFFCTFSMVLVVYHTVFSLAAN